VLPSLLGREPEEALLRTVLESLGKRGQRGQRLWEPLAKLVGLAGADALRKTIERAR
jgi:hypothetical protein